MWHTSACCSHFNNEQGLDTESKLSRNAVIKKWSVTRLGLILLENWHTLPSSNARKIAYSAQNSSRQRDSAPTLLSEKLL